GLGDFHASCSANSANSAHCPHFSLFPDSRLPTPDSRLPTPDSLLRQDV
ncbi:MAG: hypothetical protein F6K26_37700, partial [Moorea sp. SIO2I5]|nr:hypothetical protein [Moorena sp. SIO2I5]